MQRASSRKYLANTGWLLAEQIVRCGLGFLFLVIVARHLGPEKFGLFNYALSLVLVFAVFVQLGIDDIVAREIIRRPGLRNEILGSVFAMKLSGCFFMCACLSVVLWWLGDGFETVILVAWMAGGYLFMAFQVANVYFQSQVLAKYGVIASLVAFSVFSLARVVFIILELPVSYFAFALFLDFMFTGLLLGIIFHVKVSPLFDWRFSMRVCRKLVRQGWPLFATALAGLFVSRIDQIMIKRLLGDSANGCYASAVMFSESWYFVPMAIAISFYPAIIEAKRRSCEEYDYQMRCLGEALVWLGIVVGIVGTLVAPLFIPLVFGGAFSGGSAVLQAHIWTGVFVAFSFARLRWLIIENLQAYLPLFLIVSGACCFILNLILIPRFGIQGGALAAVLSQFVNICLCPLMFNKTRRSVVYFIETLFPRSLINLVLRHYAR